MSKFFTKYVDENTVLPDARLFSAVFLVAINGSKILVTENERGWEVPGGHIEAGEDCKQALIREIKEEAGAIFSDEQLIAIIESDNKDEYKDKIMLIYTTKDFTLGEFTPIEDAFNRDMIEIEEFIKIYKGGIDFKEIIPRALHILQN